MNSNNDLPATINSYLITDRQGSCGNVLFSQASVILSMGGRVSLVPGPFRGRVSLVSCPLWGLGYRGEGG